MICIESDRMMLCLPPQSLDLIVMEEGDFILYSICKYSTEVITCFILNVISEKYLQDAWSGISFSGSFTKITMSSVHENHCLKRLAQVLRKKLLRSREFERNSTPCPWDNFTQSISQYITTKEIFCFCNRGLRATVGLCRFHKTCKKKKWKWKWKMKNEKNEIIQKIFKS